MVMVPQEISGVSIEFDSSVSNNVSKELLNALNIVLKKDISPNYPLNLIWISSLRDSHEWPGRHVTGNAVDISRLNGKKIGQYYKSDLAVKEITTALQNKFEEYDKKRENFGPEIKLKEGVAYDVSNHEDHIHFSVNGNHIKPNIFTRILNIFTTTKKEESCKI